VKVRFSGFGGQGVVMCGLVFGEAAMIDGKNALQTQAYGSASRGGLTRSDVCVQDDEIHDLVFDDLDALVAMSQQAFDAYEDDLADGGLLIVESDMVDHGGRAIGIPATDIAYKEFGRKVMANMVMMGYVNEKLGLLSHDALVETIRKRVPPGTEDKNEAAYREGIRLAAEGSA
jgi:2-oxoglutarate ferredoxin oxidoreductase subunit gamma